MICLPHMMGLVVKTNGSPLLTRKLCDRGAVLHNLRTDEEVAAFANASGVGAHASLLLEPSTAATAAGGACTAISFRTGAASCFALQHKACFAECLRFPYAYFSPMILLLENCK